MSQTEQHQQSPNPIFAAAVLEELNKHRWSNVGAQIGTGVNRGVIQSMRKGLRVGADQIIKWADALCKDCDPEELASNRARWLRLSGWEDLVHDGAAVNASHKEETSGASTTEVREQVFDDLIEAGFGDLAPDDREEILELIRLKHARLQRRRTIGSRAMTEDEERAEHARMTDLNGR